MVMSSSGELFLPTPSTRRATLPFGKCISSFLYFYPRPPRGGRRYRSRCRQPPTCHFYPRPPRGGRQLADGAMKLAKISTHALHEEGDSTFVRTKEPRSNFYPRPPRGGRQTGRLPCTRGYDFYPRPPRGGRLKFLEGVKTNGYFYPRPPRGGRPLKNDGWANVVDFYPRPPRGGRHTPYRARTCLLAHFYPRPPRGGRPLTGLFTIIHT